MKIPISFIPLKGFSLSTLVSSTFRINFRFSLKRHTPYLLYCHYSVHLSNALQRASPEEKYAIFVVCRIPFNSFTMELYHGGVTFLYSFLLLL